jgi:serine/threonine protein kinase
MSSPDDTDPALTIPNAPTAPGYEILDTIARSGMTDILRARDRTFHREVAIKVLHSCVDQERLLREARITAQLAHPGIVPVSQVGQLSDGRPFMAMKLVRGNTLNQLLRTGPNTAADRERLLAVFDHVCQTLAFAHARGVIHRNLKPTKVMVGAFGEVLLLGWGVARLTADSEVKAEPDHTSDLSCVMGTPVYMPPEQARGEVADTRSDVFGLGGILCAILTGQPPFPFYTDVVDMIQRAVAGDLTETFARLDACGADPELIALAKRCLAPNRADRPADAGALAALVAEYRRGIEKRSRGPDRKHQRFRVVVVLLLLVAVVLLFVNAVLLWQRN